MLIEYFNEINVATVNLSRSSDSNSWSQSLFKFNERPEEIKLVIHAANPKAPRSKAVIKQFVKNTNELLEISSKNKFQILFISTLSIHPWNFSDYSKYKSEIEKKFLTFGGSAVRLGLLKSDDLDSTYQRLFELIEKSKIMQIALRFSKSVFFNTDQNSIKNLVKQISENPILESKVDLLTNGEPFYIQKLNSEITQVKISNETAHLPLPIFITLLLKLVSKFHFGPADSFVNLCSGQKSVINYSRFVSTNKSEK